MFTYPFKNKLVDFFYTLKKMLHYWSFYYSIGHWRRQENQTACHLTATQTMGLSELSPGETSRWDIIPDRCSGPSGLLQAPPVCCPSDFLFALG